MRSRVPCEPHWYVGQSGLRHEEILFKDRQELGVPYLQQRSPGVAEREAGPTFRHWRMGTSAVTPLAGAHYRLVLSGESYLFSLMKSRGHRISYHTAIWPWTEYNSAAFALSCISASLMETTGGCSSPVPGRTEQPHQASKASNL